MALEFPPLENDLLLRAAARQRVPRVPVWMMRQAGRYLPEFRELRADVDFFTVCRTPELAAEVTLQPLRRFPLDAAIIFSDILVIPQAMGMEVQMVKGHGPHFPDPLQSPADITALTVDGAENELGYVYDAVSLTRRELGGRVPLIGFAGAPWTLMAYMVEGGGSKTFSKAKTWLFAEPEASRRLLDALTTVVIAYLKRKISAGAQAVQVFDSWAGVLAPHHFREFAMPALARIASELKAFAPEVPLVVFARGAHYALPELAGLDYDVVGLDWTIEPARARELAGGNAALQGNLDPCTLYADRETIRREVERMVRGFGTQAYIANLGHGMHPDHDPARAGAFVDAVHEMSEKMIHEAVEGVRR